MDNPTALAALQSEKALLERDAAALRESLHKLHQAGREHELPAHVWQAEFARQHEKLVIVAGKIGGLDKRILALVEGKEKSSESTLGA
jgi:tRNA G37 N-methylase TrmD